MSAEKDNFFDVPLKKFQTSKGVIDLPIFYPDYGYAHFFFWADYNKVVPKLEGTIFKPCRFFNGKAGVLLNFFQYRNSAIGPYNEVGLSIISQPKKAKKVGPFAAPIQLLLKNGTKWKIGAYVINLPVTTEIAYVGGKEVWNYPKFVTNITVDLNGRQFNGAVDDPVLKQPIFTLKGKIGFLPGVFGISSFVSNTTHQGKALRTLTTVDSKSKSNLLFSSKLWVNDQSKHNMATNLVDMGLKNKKPFLALYNEKARMILHQGVPIE